MFDNIKEILSSLFKAKKVQTSVVRTKKSAEKTQLFNELE